MIFQYRFRNVKFRCTASYVIANPSCPHTLRCGIAEYQNINRISKYQIFDIMIFWYDIITILIWYYHITVDISLVCHLTVIFDDIMIFWYDIITILIWYYHTTVDISLICHLTVIFDNIMIFWYDIFMILIWYYHITVDISLVCHLAVFPLIGSSNSEYPALFTSEQLGKKWRASWYITITPSQICPASF